MKSTKLQNAKKGQKVRKARGKSMEGKRSMDAMTNGVPRSIERPFNKLTDVVRIKRWTVSSLYPQTSAAIPTTYTFKLDQVPGYTTLTSDWDFYRIVMIDVLYEPASRCGSTAATGTAAAPHVFVRVNFDSDSSASYDQIREYNNTRVYSLMQRWEHSFVPKVAIPAYAGVTEGYTVPNGNPWLATSSVDTEYYGLQYVTSQVTTGTQFGGTIFYRFHIEFKAGL